MNATPLYDLAPAGVVAALGASIALALIAGLSWRHRKAPLSKRIDALALLTLFLCFDLVLFGAFTRLSDSGLGCPDWPGCYGHASPVGAGDAIDSAQSTLPQGPVTPHKAWIEMTHRYLATAVGALIAAMVGLRWLERRRGLARSKRPVAVAGFVLVWVCLQGAFGALTVTWRLYPAIVTGHLMGGMVLLALLAVQAFGRPSGAGQTVPRRLRWAACAVAALCGVQIMLGAWVSTNYAVLACSDFPQCQGQWWPEADFRQGFTLLRGLGEAADGGYLPFSALTAIHLAHRWMAALVLVALLALGAALRSEARRSGDALGSRLGVALYAIAAWQAASGVSNVVLGWPIVAALAHTGGAAALVVVLTRLIIHQQAGRAVPADSAEGRQRPRIDAATRLHHV